ncbi:DNA polymerase III subunit alpha [Prosthecobacter sp.]|uniref:DNA polymerase III subunit alpha n=1 Tax=Prosthecobacter sp. TaxID=1965333 RepID=UPI003784AEC3
MIVHLDADAYFASVEQAADPKLRGRPIAVGGEKRGIIASASYEARKLGIYTPMPTARARKLCPKLIVLPGDFEKYERFSRFMFSYAFDFTPEVEITSIDEGYFDLKGLRKGTPEAVAQTIRKAIAQRLKITVSEGIGSNKLVSQVASKLKKPASLIEVPRGHEREFLAPLPNQWLPNVGPKLSGTLKSAGLALIREVAETPVEMLALLVGGYGHQLREFAHGIDQRPLVVEKQPAKSYGEQHTFETDVTEEAVLIAQLYKMADNLTAKVREDRCSFRTITLKLRYNDMQDVTRSTSLEEPSDLAEDIFPLFSGLLKKAWDRRVSVRLIGLKLSHIYGSVFRSELPLEADSMKRLKMQKLAPVFDQLRRDHQIMRGNELVSHSIRRSKTIFPAFTKPASTIKLLAGLNFKSQFSFLDSLLSPEEVVALAKEAGFRSVAITDPNLHGVVPFFQAAKEAGIKAIVGAELKAVEGSRLVYVANATGYQNLCHLLSVETLREKEIQANCEGLLFADPSTHALPEIRYRTSQDRRKHGIVQSIRTLTRLNQKHPEKRRGDYSLQSAHAQLGSFTAEQIRASNDLAEQCDFSFDFETLRFPRFTPADGSTPNEMLYRLAVKGLERRYGDKAQLHKAQLEEELGIIAEVGYEEYFLAVWELLQDCKTQGIEWITRGSAADSLVCYSLGISGVCPIRFDLYFRRFLNRERMAMNKLPDIDIDFPHDRKDDVVDLIFRRYGNQHAAIVGGFNTFQGRSALADIAKVLGVSEHQIRRFTERVPHTSAARLSDAVKDSQECQDHEWDEEPYKTALEMAGFLDGFPRYRKMHPCGVVISRDAIHSLTPTFISAKGYPTTHMDMDAVEAIGLIKMDILAQGGLAVMRDTVKAIEKKGVPVDIEAFEPWEDPEVWEMIASGGARAVHHIESPAMISLCKMTNVREIDGLVAIVSVIRPGAANESKKLKFTRRYQGLEPVYYPDPSLESCLKSTFGLVVYEEHILQICEAFAGMPPGRGDVLRRALNKQKAKLIAELKLEFIACSRARGHTKAKIDEVWELVSGFNGYAFCRAHSTAYGVEAYQAAWLKRYHPAEFMAAVLTHGKGFYSPLVYALECYRLGLHFKAPCINNPSSCFETDGTCIQVPVRSIKGISEKTLARLEAEVRHRSFSSLRDFCDRVRPAVDEVENMIRAGAFDVFGDSRPLQYWQSRALLASKSEEDRQEWLLRPPDVAQHLQHQLHEPTLKEKLEWEYDLFGFTISGHPLDLYPEVAWETYCPVERLHEFVGKRVVCCGLVIEQRLHHQTTGELMKFLSLADRTGIVETELFADTYKSYGAVTVRYPVLEVDATVEPYENGRGFSLRVFRVSKARTKS